MTHPERIAFEGCPVCGSGSYEHYQRGEVPTERGIGCLNRGIQWERCSECGHVFAEGYFTEEAAAELYSRVSETQRVGHDIERRRWESARIIEKVLPFAREGKWLDVGFGDGSLLFTADEFGFEPMGVELLEESVKAIESLGVQAFSGGMDAVEGEASFSVVSLMDVIEHVPDPRGMLEQASTLLGPGGVLLLSTPRRDTIIWEALGNLPEGNPFYNEIEHYHCFDLKTIENLLSDAGFKFERYGVTERYRSCMQIIATKRR